MDVKRQWRLCLNIFNVPTLYIGNSALMSLYAMGELNGLVIDIGNRMQVIPINDGVIETHAALQLKKGVTNINKYLADLLEDRGHYFTSARDMDEIRLIKEKCCYVAGNYDLELQRPESEILRKYKRENGDIVELGQERFKCPELLFNPSRLGILDAQFALPSIISDVVMKCPLDTRVNLFSNMLLVGGGTLIPGIAQRLEQDVYNTIVNEHGMKAARRGNIKCHNPVNRKYISWQGASIFCMTEGWSDRATTIDEYYETGKTTLAEQGMFK